MEELLSFKRMAWFSPAGAPLVVLAAGRIGPNNWWGECCVFIPEQLGFRPMSSADLDVVVAASAYPKDVEVIDADYMRLELERKAVDLLSAHLSPIASHMGQRDLYELRYKFHDGSKMDIYRLIMNGAFIAEVQDIAKRTKHPMLRDYLAAIAKHIVAKIDSTPQKKASPYE